MVEFTPEDLDAMRRSRARMEEMSEMDRDICSADKPTHLVIPLDDIFNLRRIADVLRGLASDLDILSRRHDMKARSIIMEARHVIRYSNKRIRDMKTGYEHPWNRDMDPRFRPMEGGILRPRKKPPRRVV